jgi:acyl transferase domain-containing protein
MPKSRPAEGQPVTPIAVIGMACRFSGMATSPEALWEMMANGLDGWSDEAPDRFSLQSFWHPKADNGGSVSILTWSISTFR